MFRLVVLLCVALAVLTACGGSSSNQTSSDDPDAAGHVLSEAALESLDPALREVAAQARTMTYASRNGVNDAVSHVTGTVFVPKGDRPKEGFPIVALGHRTTGTSSDCAPSLSPDLRGELATVVALLKAGYVVTVPDYQGMGQPSKPDDYDFHPYLDSTTAGYNMIDAVRAAHAMVPNTSTSWAALGALEGGQAAWAANELVDNYGSDLKLLATAALAPMANIEGLAEAAMNGTLNTDQKLAYVAYLAALKDQYYYDFELDDYRRGAAEQNWDALRSCNDNAQRRSLAERLSADDLRPAGPEALQTLRGYLQKTNLPQGPTKAPMYVIYSGLDSIIPPAWTDRALIDACAMGDAIQIAFWPDKTRDQVQPVAALGWLNDRMKAMPAADDCPAFVAGHRP
ncbi:lipase family protein [Mycolicibacterium fortuitum]|uniref:lipase family protein n=1 Tax=Mycolicibacterium fortuitum TaxID=1766 RepID=UPI0009452ED7|nr:lipase family protein [Mycolicibacterium fortuitum]